MIWARRMCNAYFLALVETPRTHWMSRSTGIVGLLCEKVLGQFENVVMFCVRKTKLVLSVFFFFSEKVGVTMKIPLDSKMKSYMQYLSRRV